MKNTITAIRICFFILFIFLILKGKMMLWFAIYAASLVVALFFGRLYCSYACPMNTLIIPTQWLSKKAGFQKESPKWLSSGKLPWVALVGSVVLMLIGKKILHINIPVLIIWLAISILVTFIYKPYVFHNLICPFGILQKAFGRFARFSKKVDKESCNGCTLCETVCPSLAISVDKSIRKADIEVSSCLQCTNCAQICPVVSIRYGKVSDM